MASLTPSPKMQFFDANGNPLVGGTLKTYESGTSTPLATYTDGTGTTANPTTITLDSRGEASVWCSNALYRFILYDAVGALIWSADDIGGETASPELWGGLAGGTADAITFTTIPRTTAHEIGQTIKFIASGDNTGPVTISPNGLDVKNITTTGGGALSAGAIKSGDVVYITFNGTSYQLLVDMFTAVGVKGPAIPSASTINLDAALLVGDSAHITGTTPITTVTLSAGKTFRAIADAALPLTHSANLIVQGGASYTCAAGDGLLFYGDGSGVVYVWVKKKDGTSITAQTVSPKRQTTLKGAVNATTGRAEFLQIGTGLTVNLLATTTPVVVTAAAGFGVNGNPVDYMRVTSADVASAWSGLTDATTNYLLEVYSGGSWSRVATTLQPKEQFGGTISTVNGQYTFDITSMKGWKGNGVTADAEIFRVVGECVTSGGTVTSVISYALNGQMLDTAWTSVVAETQYVLSHNVGSPFVDVTMHIANSANLEIYKSMNTHTYVSGSYGAHHAGVGRLKTVMQTKSIGSTVTVNNLYDETGALIGSGGFNRLRIWARRAW